MAEQPKSLYFSDAQINEILSLINWQTGHLQYIGARYVPIFGRKDETDIIWDNSKPYEPLTIVLWQGNSFTSRQFVPAGIDINSNEFWAETGNYNAQVEQYRQEVLNVKTQNDKISADLETETKTRQDQYTELKKDIKTISEDIGKDYLVVFGDSWSAAGYWVNNYAKGINASYKNYSISGAGIINANTGKDFNNQLTTAINDDSYNHKRVREIILMFGCNDFHRYTDNTQLQQNFSSAMVNNMRTEFPNAKIKFFMNGWPTAPDYQDSSNPDLLNNKNMTKYRQGLIWLCNAYTIPFYDVSQLLRSDMRWFDNLYHPNATGYQLLATSMLSLNNQILNENTKSLKPVFVDDVPGLTLTSMENSGFQVTEGKTSLIFNGAKFNASDAQLRLKDHLNFIPKNLNAPIYTTAGEFYGQFLTSGTYVNLFVNPNMLNKEVTITCQMNCDLLGFFDD